MTQPRRDIKVGWESDEGEAVFVYSECPDQRFTLPVFGTLTAIAEVLEGEFGIQLADTHIAHCLPCQQAVEG